MSTPIATPSELGTLLSETIGEQDVRGLLVLALAQARCELWVTPLPAAAKGIVLAVAARAWTNIAGVNQVGLGSAYATMSTAGVTSGGLYVSKSEKADLRRLAGRSGAFSVDWIPQGRSEIQAIVVEASAGTFLLGYGTRVTSPIPFDAATAQMQAALESLFGAGTVTVGDGFLATFKGALANTGVGPIVADDSQLTGTVTVVTVQDGQPAPWCS